MPLINVVVESYLGLLEGGLSSDVEEEVDGGRRSEEDEEDRMSREPAIPTISRNKHSFLMLQKKIKFYWNFLK